MNPLCMYIYISIVSFASYIIGICVGYFTDIVPEIIDRITQAADRRRKKKEFENVKTEKSG